MNGAYLHLLVNHIPVVAFPICFLLLLLGTMKKSNDLIQAGFIGLVLAALIATVAWKSGGPAARTLFHYPGVSVARERVHEHAEAGEYGLIVGGILGVFGLFGWWLSRRPEGAPAAIVWLTILGSLAVSVTFGRVAHLGGLIRHPEINTSAEPAPMTPPAAVPRLPAQ